MRYISYIFGMHDQKPGEWFDAFVGIAPGVGEELVGLH